MSNVGRPRKLVGVEEKVCKDYIAGATLQQVADSFGCCVNTVRRVLIDSGCARRKVQPPAQARGSNTAEVERALMEGERQSNIAARLDISRQRVFQIASRMMNEELQP